MARVCCIPASQPWLVLRDPVSWLDPTPHFDTCIGAGGADQALTCERAVAI
jgi:hypothetical protein